jgi:hypothetical protein
MLTDWQVSGKLENLHSEEGNMRQSNCSSTDDDIQSVGTQEQHSNFSENNENYSE